MRPTKALHRAATASLDGHLRFFVTVRGVARVMTLPELACCNEARVRCALFCGHVVNPRR
jgi:hypothetical protein